MNTTERLADVIKPGEFVVEFQDAGPDDFGRRRFIAYWLDTNLGYYRNEKGVRGQILCTSPTDFRARLEANGNTVRFLEEN